MATCSPQELIADAACFTCISPGMQQLVNTALLCRIATALNPAMTCDVQTLVSEAACFTCIPPGMQALVNTQLLCNIAGALTGSGGGSIVGSGCLPSTNGDPEGVLVSPCSPALAVDPNTKAIYMFTGVAGTSVGWQLKV